MDEPREQFTDGLAQALQDGGGHVDRPSTFVLRIGQWYVPTALVGFPTSLLLHLSILTTFCLMPWHAEDASGGSLAKSQRVVQVTVYLKPSISKTQSSQGAQSPASAGGPKRPKRAELAEAKRAAKPKTPAKNSDLAAQADPSDSRPSIDGPSADATAQTPKPTDQTNTPDKSLTGPKNQAVSDKPGDDQLADQLSNSTSSETEDVVEPEPEVIESPSLALAEAELVPTKLDLATATHEIDHDPAPDSTPIVMLAKGPPTIKKTAEPLATEKEQPDPEKTDRQSLGLASIENNAREPDRTDTNSLDPNSTGSKTTASKAQPSATTSTSASEAQAGTSRTPSSFVRARVIDSPDNLSQYYPRRSRLIGEQGEVTLRIEVLPDGSVGEIEPLDGTSSRLIKAAIKYVRDCRYAPATIKGRSVRGYIVKRIKFKF
jgi:TonB family protein